MELLSPAAPGARAGTPTEAELRSAAEVLESDLSSFGIEARVSGVVPGPVITRYEVAPAPGVTVSSIVARADDIALAMRARGIRMIAPIPGKAAIGVEIPNPRPAVVGLREVLQSPAMQGRASPLAFALGLSSEGIPMAADLQELPNILVAGATNSGKSAMVHSLILSILLRSNPDRARLLLIDPKRVELSLYDGIPHLYDPRRPSQAGAVITQPREAAEALKALAAVMLERYERLRERRVRDIAAFNTMAAERGEAGEPYIVVIVDEFADLMSAAGTDRQSEKRGRLGGFDINPSRTDLEDALQRIAQMGRAVGIHFALATQRPSVDVITGVIKANLPARLALRVPSKVDSLVILDAKGAEALLGRGDMLFSAPGRDLIRAQGCYVTTEEISRVADYLRAQGGRDIQ